MTQQPVSVGNSIQQQAAPAPDSQIQQHTIQEEGEKSLKNIILPDLDLHLTGNRYKELVNNIHSLLLEINEEYRLSQDALDTLKENGLIPFLHELTEEQIDWQKDAHMPWWYFGPGALVGNIIDKSVNDGWTMSAKRSFDNLGMEALNNIVQTAIFSLIPGARAFSIINGVLTAIFQCIMFGLSFPSKDEGEQYINEWYNKAMGQLSGGYHQGNINIDFQ